MARPGTVISLRDTAPPRSAPTNTAVWFVVGITEKGPIVPTSVKSMTEYKALFGARVSTGILYDALDTFFHEGGAQAYISRVVGPAAVTATKNLVDNVAAVALTVNAKNPGAWGNALRIAVLAGDVGGNFKLQVSTVADGILETSADLADTAAAVAWGANSAYVTVVQGASILDPVVVAATALLTGSDDTPGIAEAHWKIALDKITKDYGPGQISYPGRTTTVGYADLLAHAIVNNRAALLDGADTSSSATLLTAVAGQRLNGRAGAFFAPWIVVPGYTPGTTRTVPHSAFVAGLIARSDPARGANSPAAGSNGQAQWALGLSQAQWTDTVRESLNVAGVNVALLKYGGVREYGWRSLADPVIDLNWTNYGNWRLATQVIAQLDPILEEFLFDTIDGQGNLLSAFGGAIRAELIPFWTSGQLYGATPDAAFAVDVGTAVNTTATIAAGELHAVVSLKMSPFAEFIQLELVKKAISEVVA